MSSELGSQELNNRMSELEDRLARQQEEERILREEHTLLRLFIEHAPAAIAMFDIDMRYVAVTDRWLQDYGLVDRRNIGGRTFYETFSYTPERWKAIHQRCLSGASESHDADQIYRKDGSITWINWNAHPWYRAQGEVGGIIIFSEIIPDPTVTQEALVSSNDIIKLPRDPSQSAGLDFTKPSNALRQQLSEAAKLYKIDMRANTVINNIPGGLVQIFDRNLNYVFIGGEGMRQLGLTDEKLIGRSISDVLNPNLAALYETQCRLALNGDTVRFEGSYSGQSFLFTAAPLRDIRGEIDQILVQALNITERKRAEKAYKENETLLQASMEHSEAGIVHVNADGHYFRVNQEICDILGYTRDELLQLTFAQVTHPDDVNSSLEYFHRLVAGEIPEYSIEKRYIRKDGSEVWVSITAETLLDFTGKTICYAVVIEDIMARKKIAQALRESGARYRSLAQNLPKAAVVLLDWHLRHILGEGTLLYEFGYTSLQVAGKALQDVLPTEIVSALEPKLRLALTGEETFLEHRENNQFFEVVITPVEEETGHILSVMMVVRDITEQKRAENELRLMLNLSAKISQAPDFESSVKVMQEQVCEYMRGIHSEAWLPDNEGQVLSFFTAHMMDIDEEHKRALVDSYSSTQYPYDKGVGRAWSLRSIIRLSEDSPGNWQVVMVKDGRVTQIPFDYEGPRWNLFMDIGVRSIVFMPIVVDEEVLLVFVFASRHADTADPQLLKLLSAAASVVAVALKRRQIQDELEIRSRELEHSNQELKELAEREKELNELKSSFTSMVSHEFRTPLAVILSASETMQRHFDRLTPEYRQTKLELIKGQVRHLTDLIEDVLFIGRAESVGLKFDPVKADVVELCAEFIGEFMLDDSSAIQVQFFHEGACTKQYVDVDLWRHILQNLISNAIKYTPEGGRVTLSLNCTDTQTIVVVADEGIGIPEKDQQQLFTPFHRASNVGQIQGTGFGLAIVKRAVERHGGTIEFTSVEGQGTTFTVTLPSGHAKSA